MRSIVCHPTKSECNHFEEMYVINPKQNTPAVMPYTLRVITYALRRLHTNPSDWIKIKHLSKQVLYFLSFVSEKELVKNRVFTLWFYKSKRKMFF